MEKMTITEALSEINLIKKKVEKKKTTVGESLIYPEHVKDPFESEGGSKATIKRELQAINDLNTRLIKLRSVISNANLSNTITLGETTMSIHDWLTWKREVSKQMVDFNDKIYRSVKNTLDQLMKQPQVFKDTDGNNKLVKPLVMVDTAEILRESERLNTVLEQLDGKLSLKNATIVVEI